VPTPNVPPEAPAAEQVACFRADVARLIGTAEKARFGVAVSGGPDSMAMLLLAAAAFPGRVEAATVDHGLRAESGAEAALVASRCAAMGVVHATLQIRVAGRGNVSANARTARYAALAAWRTTRGIDWLMTAHHADDQLETVIMRLNRGSGVGGLAGIRPVSGQVIRPLLRWRRRGLTALVEAAGVPTVDDPSNRDDRYDRARLRKALADIDWLDPVAVAVSAENLADADAAIGHMLELAEVERLFPGPDGSWRFDAEGLPREMVRRAFVACLRRLQPSAAPRGDTIDSALAALRRGKAITIGRVLVAAAGTDWSFRPAPPRRTKARPPDETTD
jgi:tRNA(Ile)-lysidine synthase